MLTDLQGMLLASACVTFFFFRSNWNSILEYKDRIVDFFEDRKFEADEKERKRIENWVNYDAIDNSLPVRPLPLMLEYDGGSTLDDIFKENIFNQMGTEIKDIVDNCECHDCGETRVSTSSFHPNLTSPPKKGHRKGMKKS